MNWMEENCDVLKNKNLNNVVLPGTHNSGTYCINSYSEYTCDAPEFLLQDTFLGMLGRFCSKSIVKNFAICQNKTINEQLDDGIRYIDLRVCESDDPLGHICHSLKCGDVKNILTEISTFLKNNSKEIVILDFKRLLGFKNKENWIKNITEFCVKEFGNLLIPFSEIKELKMENLWNKGYQILIFIPYEDLPKQFWTRNYIENAWADSTNSSKIIDYVTKHRAKRNNEKFHISEYIITPDHELIQNNLFSSLESINSSFIPIFHKTLKNDEKFNIITCDFYQKSFIKLCINMNKS